MAGPGFGGAMDARRNGTAGIIHGKAPEIANAEAKRSRLREGSVVEIVAIFFQVFAKGIVIAPAEKLEKFGAGFGNVHVSLGFVIAQAFARRAVIGAKPGVGFNRCAVGVEGVNIGGHSPWIFVTRVGMNAVEDWGKTMRPEKSLVIEENVDGGPARCAHRKSIQSRVVDGGYAVADGEMFHDFAETAGQCALPAEGIDVVSERGRDEFIEVFHQLDAGVAARQDESIESLEFRRQHQRNNCNLKWLESETQKTGMLKCYQDIENLAFSEKQRAPCKSALFFSLLFSSRLSAS